MIQINRVELELALEGAMAAAGAALVRAAVAARHTPSPWRRSYIQAQLKEHAFQAGRQHVLASLLRRCARAGDRAGVAPALWPKS